MARPRSGLRHVATLVATGPRLRVTAETPGELPAVVLRHAFKVLELIELPAAARVVLEPHD
jgi:hypothetical protein